MDNKMREWDSSYLNRDNFVFYPHEEVIRFTSKYILKQVGLNEFRFVRPLSGKPSVLDVGCGIGRHVFYFHTIGFDSYGIDLSNEAIKVAREWGSNVNIPEVENRIIQGDIQNMPWGDETFDYAVSHGVFDSTYFIIAKNAFKETARILKKSGLFYCDLISGDDSNHAREFWGEEVVEAQHEKGTIQMYYNYSKIQELVQDDFDVLELNLIRRENILSGSFHSRYHLVLRKKDK
ncbi:MULTISPECIES: class I SAM-dependent methyltransferase [Brevibacillus]|mgnify:CR=1 FL=1|jgi:ubiquinone/menaquinone biosynthesis C-methylase UbiE|uniref:class I SAM-dependent methyltransferase n=1 Tax=Brevibacillus TaxID=55080 RepID=UPI00156B1AB9|nr:MULTISPECIES: class I SAM-dependent methyltransferase [Brevibacillus]MBU8715018.1 methyltransferase domain-containing protein [Brevibacillus parabrevis]MED2255218.1 class I SAM-dependent methyltransferase [Brevibacillus parabrevis]UED70015.1 class I SAM-dependent methyltransferase [Brevibacillus sp. HD3.3A]WDV96314.1 class I SAM-dependent methyltransferase [Brevibacillus parabrevis]